MISCQLASSFASPNDPFRQGHPYEPLLAVSGIDKTIKIFSPDSQAQDDARVGVNIGSSSNDSSGYNSVSERRRRARGDAANGSESGNSKGQGLSSRKCMHQSYQIISQNDLERQGGGMRHAFITVGSGNPLSKFAPGGSFLSKG